MGKIYLVIFLHVFLFDKTFSQSTPTTTKPTVKPNQTIFDIVASGNALIKKQKEDFEKEIKKEIGFRKELYNAYRDYQNEFFNALEYDLFDPEVAKADSLINALKSTPDVKCVSHLKDYINEVKNEHGRREFSFCIMAIDSDITRVNETISTGQINLITAYKEAEQRIKGCQKYYEYYLDNEELKTCVSKVKSAIESVVSIYGETVTTLTPEKLLTDLITCTDKIITSIYNYFFINYHIIRKCIGTSSNPVSQEMEKLIVSTYLIANRTSNKRAEVLSALQSLKANSSAYLDIGYRVKSKVVQVINRKNRSKDILKSVILRSGDAIKYGNAFSKASVDLALDSTALRCLQEAQNRFQDSVLAKTNELQKCSESIQLTITESEVNEMITSIEDRQNKEGIVPIIKCLGGSGPISQNKTLTICSERADRSFITFLLIVQFQLNDAGDNAELISKLINSCEKSILPDFKSTQSINIVSLENCLRNNASINYTVTGI